MNNLKKTLINEHLYTVRLLSDRVNDTTLGAKDCASLYNSIFFDTTFDTTLEAQIVKTIKARLK